MSERRHRRRERVLAAILGGIVVLVLAVNATPWPSALLIRAVFEQNGAKTTAAMQEHVPDVEFEEHLDVQYAEGSESPDTTLDVFSPPGDGALPTVVWVHGGAWISGSKANVDPYLRILAAEGYTTVGLQYTVGPEATYPTAVRQLNEALAFLQVHADEYRIDPDRIVLAGDSAGGNLASQLSALVTNPDYADLMGIRPALEPAQLAGVILNCGVYDMQAMADLTGIAAWGFKAALWAYTGTRNWSDEPEGLTMSTIRFATEDFPATYITGGNGDGLTWLQSIPMAQRLEELGVDVTKRFYEADHGPALPHEYQFQLETEEAQDVLQDTISFLERVTG